MLLTTSQTLISQNIPHPLVHLSGWRVGIIKHQKSPLTTGNVEQARKSKHLEMAQQQSLLISNAVILLLCMIAGALSASLGSQVYSEAVPNRDYTLQNMSRADEVFASQTRYRVEPQYNGHTRISHFVL